MERGEINGSASVSVPEKKNKLEEPRSVGVTNSTARRQRRQEWAKKLKRTRREKRNGREKPGKPDDANETAVDSKDEISLPPAGEGKRRKKLVTQGLVDCIVRVEMVDYMLGEPLRLVPDDDRDDEFGFFDAGVSALIFEGIEENADVLRLFRTGKHAQLLINEDTGYSQDQ